MKAKIAAAAVGEAEEERLLGDWLGGGVEGGHLGLREGREVAGDVDVLYFTLSHPVSTVIIGCDNLAQLATAPPVLRKVRRSLWGGGCFIGSPGVVLARGYGTRESTRRFYCVRCRRVCIR